YRGGARAPIVRIEPITKEDSVSILNRFRIRARLIAGFVAVFILLGLGTLIGAWRLADLGHTVDQLVAAHTAKLVTAQRWERGISLNLVRAHASLVIDDRALVDELKRDIDATSKDITAAQNEVEALADEQREHNEIAAIVKARSQYRKLRD